MCFSPVHVGFVAILFLLLLWFIYLTIRSHRVLPRVGPYYVMLYPTARGIIQGYCTNILSDHVLLTRAMKAADEARAEDHTGHLFALYSIVVYDSRTNTIYKENN